MFLLIDFVLLITTVLMFIYAKKIYSKIIDFGLYMNMRDKSPEEKQKIKNDILPSGIILLRIIAVVCALITIRLFFV